jgi:hypothetical protein
MINHKFIMQPTDVKEFALLLQYSASDWRPMQAARSPPLDCHQRPFRRRLSADGRDKRRPEIAKEPTQNTPRG